MRAFRRGGRASLASDFGVGFGCAATATAAGGCERFRGERRRAGGRTAAAAALVAAASASAVASSFSSFSPKCGAERCGAASSRGAPSAPNVRVSRT